MVLVENWLAEIRAQMGSARDKGDYELIAKLDKQLHNELLATDMKQLASNPVQLQQLTELLDWYRSVIGIYELEKNDLRTELNSRSKNKNAVGRYQEVAFSTAG